MGRRVTAYPDPMQVNILFFGLLRDTFGASETLTVPDEATVADIAAHYSGKAPHLGELWKAIAVAVNQRYVTAGEPVADGDEVALLPPVSGGLS
jgi:molybdopterin converting factor subunit 1